MSSRKGNPSPRSDKLLLDAKGCVFLLAVDREVIERAIFCKYKDLIGLGCLLRNLPQHQTARSLHKSYASLPLELHRENPAFSEEQSITPMLTGGLPQPFGPRIISKMWRSLSLPVLERQGGDSHPEGRA